MRPNYNKDFAVEQVYKHHLRIILSVVYLASVLQHDMNLQLTGLLVVWYASETFVSAGLLPEGGSNGYQYNRPAGGAFGASPDPSRNVFTDGDAPFDFASGRLTNSYGPPGYNNGIGFNAPGRLGGAYAGPNNGYSGSGNYRGTNGVGQPGYNGFPDAYRNRYNLNDNRPRPYSFQYEVRDPPSGNDYGQREASDGNVVRGEYRVLLPDSRTQIVKYSADDVNGYNADVQYEGQAAPGYQFPGETSYQPGFTGLGGPYQGRGGYNGAAGGFPVRGIFGGSGVAVDAVGPGNQYLPPGGGGYGK